MPENTQTTPDAAGIERTETGQIANLAPPEPITEKPTETTKLAGDTTEKLQETLLAEPTDDIPEKYEFTAPKEWEEKGFELDSGIIDAATPIFKELKLTQTQAQKLVDFYAAQSLKDHESSIQLVRDTVKGWEDQIKADPEIGGKIPQVKQVVGRVIDSLGKPLADGFRQAMNETGVGSHPAFVKAFYALAQRLSEGTHIQGRGPSPLGQDRSAAMPRSVAEAMYPNLNRTS